jgi:hypothetical protein
MVPVKVSERDSDSFLFVAHGAEVSAEISQSRARVNDDDAVRIGQRDPQAGSVSAELLKTGIADGNGSARTVKLKPHRIVFRESNFSFCEHQARDYSAVPIATNVWKTDPFVRRLQSAVEI